MKITQPTALILLLSALTLSSCELSDEKEQTAQELFSKNSGQATPGKLEGYWEADHAYFNSEGDKVTEQWRLRIEGGRITVGTRCANSESGLLVGGSFGIELNDELDRYSILVQDTKDFRDQTDDEDSKKAKLTCGTRVQRSFSFYAYVDRFSLDLEPFLEHLEFEKISD